MPANPKKNRKPEKNREGSFRIIAGEHRSRRLSFPESDGLRPTTDRVRETLFNWLQNEIPGARVLDLFAGSGALGFESASRGASFVEFVELNKGAFDAIQKHIAALKITAKSCNVDALQYLQDFHGDAFDIVFIDPPFRKDMVTEVLRLLLEKSIVSPNGLVYLETEAELANLTVPDGFKELRSKKAGQVSYRLFELAGLPAQQ